MTSETLHITYGTEMRLTMSILTYKNSYNILASEAELKLQLGQVNYCMKFFCVTAECCGVGTPYA